MTYGVKLRVQGSFACFSRPEMKVERVSYDVITPSAARGILSAIHWKPAITWVIDRIHVLKPICFQSIRRNEVASKIPVSKVKSAMKSGDVTDLYLRADQDRQQRASTLLRDVDYIIEAHFDMTDRAGPDDNPGKHLDTFNRRAAAGQCFQQPCFGAREFPADFTLWTEPVPPHALPDDQADKDLGWMLLDIDHHRDAPGQGHRCDARCVPLFFPARLAKGVLTVPPRDGQEVRS
ncbi:type I-C CRISPR-associated protein Cas5c [Azospirillum sp. SYSU D00513]|uniref:type I-C CRISPR-associated protein Cas5c n=1 Tax=Azospirillum sp. SYSU D00513 TaxID=2812561 RepID=UPI001A97753B|nr:type I-C CRISPR-associated protein Cas5c [Azospirillum sp. SYSU D00513]